MKKGMEISREFFHKEVKPLLQEKLPEIYNKLAFGLSGHGSECFGYDDAISVDHDFGKRIVIWMPGDVYKEYSEKIESIIKENTDGSIVETFVIEAYFYSYTNTLRGPETIEEWYSIPDSYLSTCLNGEVFEDNLGKFTEIRDRLLGYYPEDLRLYKIAHQAFKVAQSGQYNYPRCVNRGELVAARLAEADFIKHVVFLVHAINRRYTPYYKWMHRSLSECPILGKEMVEMLDRLVAAPTEGYYFKTDLIEKISLRFIDYFREAGLSDTSVTFLLNHAVEIYNKIKDEAVMEIPLFKESME